MDEKLLIRKVLNGDMSAFGYFVDTYRDMAMTIAFRICQNMQDAEDIVQDAFVKAFHNLHTFKSGSKFSTWFYSIVYNTAVTEMRRSERQLSFVDYDQMEGEDSYSDFEPFAQIEERERLDMLNKALCMMPKDESLVLTLFYLEENSIKDIEAIMGLTASNVKVKLHRARKKLHDIMTSMMKK